MNINEKNLAEAYELIEFLSDGSDCEFDNRGYCKTHMYFTVDFPGRRCPNQRAREWLARNRNYASKH